MGGTLGNPTYEAVCTDKTGHAEVVQVEFDSDIVEFAELLRLFWSNHDPTQVNRQGVDVGTQYRSAIFYHTEEQKELALQTRQQLEQSGKYKQAIATEIVPAQDFWKAEEYHQNYYQKKGISGCPI